ncbi:MAG: hypothetical protein MZV65_52620 [Chromatiales bacterium]|nr:hypothetical protein [Chromatiales bacterium]
MRGRRRRDGGLASYLEQRSGDCRRTPRSNYRRDLAALLRPLRGRRHRRLAARLDAQRSARLRRAAAPPRPGRPQHRSARCSAWRGFYRYGSRAARPSRRNPFTGVPRAEVAGKRLPKALSVEQARRLLEIDGDDTLARRDQRDIRAVLFLRAAAGRTGRARHRRGSTCATAAVTVTGKGAKTRIVPVGARRARRSAAWLGARATLAPPGEAALFVGRNGRRLGARARAGSA